MSGAGTLDTTTRRQARQSACAGVAHGLRLPQPKLSPKFFYDERGARLFEEITRLDAYYPTRTELGILEAHLPEMSRRIGPAARIVEFGSGSGVKTRALLRALELPAEYVAVDIAERQLRDFAGALRREFPALRVRPICADYTQRWTLPAGVTDAARTVAFFPGSTIGNFEQDDALSFLRRVCGLVGPGGGLLIGADLHKDAATLELAYNDPEGVTAAFNLNVLARLNRDCGTDFDETAFVHRAIYDHAHRRIEMRLVCRSATSVTVPDDTGDVIRFEPGDFIITEYSHKYTLPAFTDLTARAGWSTEQVWTDTGRLFSVWLLRADEPTNGSEAGGGRPGERVGGGRPRPLR